MGYFQPLAEPARKDMWLRVLRGVGDWSGIVPELRTNMTCFAPICDKWITLLLLTIPLSAQSTGNSIRGAVFDPSSARVPGAEATLESMHDSTVRLTASGPDGTFLFAGIPAGVYRLTISKPGFAVFRSRPLEMRAYAHLLFDAKLELAPRQDALSVDTPGLDILANGDRSVTLSRDTLDRNNSMGRNPVMNLGMVPGVTGIAGQFLGDFRAFSYSLGAILVEGQRKDTLVVAIDGVNNTRPREGNSLHSIIGMDFLEEVQVLSGHYAAEHGRSGSAHIHFTTRRGGSKFHGSAWGIFGHDALNARQFVTGTHPNIRYSNLGFQSSGPLSANPSKTTKLFWSFGYEYRRLGGYQENITNVPTALERALDFSRSGTPIVDPLAGNVPFPNGVIPAVRVSRFGRSLLNLFPSPNFSGPGGNYFAGQRQPQRRWDILPRIDYHASDNLRLNVRTFYSRQQSESPFARTGNRIPLFFLDESREAANGNIGGTYTPKGGRVHQFDIGYAGSHDNTGILDGGASRARYGMDFLEELLPANRAQRIPNIFIAGLPGLSGSSHPSYVSLPVWTFRYSYAQTRGRHMIKLGLYHERLQVNEITSTLDNGQFSITANPGLPFNTRNALANAFLGAYDSYVEQGPSIETRFRNKFWEFYAQDQWRVRPNLTIEYGLRYAWLPHWTSAWNNMAMFSPAAWDPARVPIFGCCGNLFGDVYNGVVLPGAGWPGSASANVPLAAEATSQRFFRGLHRGFLPTRRTNLQPRFSVAWKPGSQNRVVVRAGGGVFHNFAALYTTGYQRLATAPLFVEQIAISGGSTDNLRSGVRNDLVFPQDFTSIADSSRPNEVYSYSFSIQTALPAQMKLDLSYVGNLGRYLVMARNTNFLPMDYIRANLTRVLRLDLPYPTVNGITTFEPTGTSSYQGLHASLVQRGWHGLTLAFSYAWSKALGYGSASPGFQQDPFDRMAERSDMEESRRHTASISHTYEVPAVAWKPVHWLTRNWLWSGVVTLYSGRHFTATVAAGGVIFASRADILRDPHLPRSQRTRLRYIDPTALKIPEPFYYGNSSPFYLVGPGTMNYDLFVSRRIGLTDRLNMELRGDFFNAFHHANPIGYVTAVNNRAFGQVNSYLNPRTGGLGARLNW